MAGPLNVAGAYLGVAVLEGATPTALEQAADAWLNRHIAVEVVSIELQAAGAGPGMPLYLLIVYRRERRVRTS